MQEIERKRDTERAMQWIHYHMPMGITDFVMNLNDSSKMSFEEIADVLEDMRLNVSLI